MVQLPIYVHPELKDKVKEFCKQNHIRWGVVWSECWLNGAIGTPEEVQKVEDYAKKLEKERIEFRKNKSFWWRLCN